MYRIPIYQVKLVRDGSLTTERKRIEGPATAASVLHQYFEGADREHFVVLLLDTKHQIIGIHTVSVGVLDASLIHPREIFKPAILANAAAIILAHNHPSGDPTPSAEDRLVTQQMVAAGRLIGIAVMDHVIVGERPHFISFVESGMLDSSTRLAGIAA